MSRYRLVHFVPELEKGGRIPIGALVDTPSGVKVALAPHLPSVDSLGGPRRAEVCKLAQELIASATSFDELPRSLNGVAVLGDPIDTLVLDDPLSFVREFAFPPKAAEAAAEHLPGFADVIEAGTWEAQVRRMCGECHFRRSPPVGRPFVEDVEPGPGAPGPTPNERRGTILVEKTFRVLGTPWCFVARVPPGGLSDPDCMVWVDLFSGGWTPQECGSLVGASLAAAELDWDEGSIVDCDPDVMCEWQDRENGLVLRLVHAYVDARLREWLGQIPPDVAEKLESKFPTG